MTEIREVSIIVKWGGKEYSITDLTDQDTVAVLRHEIFKKTQVQPQRQKLINLKFKGKNAEDSVKLCQLELKHNYKLMMVGSTEAAIQDACQRPDDVGDVLDDFDDAEDKDPRLENYHVYQMKIQKRIREYQITEMNAPREGKHLLVLDVDYTLFDHRSTAETGAELMRPYLHEFLESAYEHYDIVIWSATGMRWIVEKMRLLGVTDNPRYKIMFHLDSNAMITVYSTRGIIDVKPLGLIWGRYSQYSAKNTIMFDDIRRNFLMNPKSGLKIRPFKHAHQNRGTDCELLKLAKYLRDIATDGVDFTKLNHRKWEQYKPRTDDV